MNQFLIAIVLTTILCCGYASYQGSLKQGVNYCNARKEPFTDCFSDVVAVTRTVHLYGYSAAEALCDYLSIFKGETCKTFVNATTEYALEKTCKLTKVMKFLKAACTDGSVTCYLVTAEYLFNTIDDLADVVAIEEIVKNSPKDIECLRQPTCVCEIAKTDQMYNACLQLPTAGCKDSRMLGDRSLPSLLAHEVACDRLTARKAKSLCRKHHTDRAACRDMEDQTRLAC